MKMLWLAVAILTSVSAQAQLSNYCRTTNNNPDAEFCSRMRYLRATINVFDQQREMALVNYNYIEQVGGTLKDNADRIAQVVPTELSQHATTLRAISGMGQQIVDMAKNKNPDVFVLTNKVSDMCLSCHTSANLRPNGSSWNEVFKIDWHRISQECNTPGRNPYLCRNMNSMATSYGYFYSASSAGVESFEATAGVAGEVIRTLQTLKANNFLHGSEQFRQKAESDAQEILDLANAKNPSVFSKTLNLANACNQCHVSGTPMNPADLKLKRWL